MRINIPYPRKNITLAILFAGATFPSSLFAQDEPDAEEIIVTGSYIRGTPQDAPSPVQVIDRDSIEAQGAAVVWDVIKNLEVNSGSFSGPENAGTGNPGLDDQLVGSSNVNLRNLGANSTLTLINGKRMVPAAAITSAGEEFVDINSIPLVMTERVEVLTDGGSALYGSDAVAGVVNIIMRTDFEGIELYGDVQGIAEASGLYDKTISGIWGWASDSGDTHLVLSGEYFDRDPVGIEYANYFDENSEFTGTVGTVGSLINYGFLGANFNDAYLNQDIIDLNVAEGGDSSPVFTDPLCYSLTSADGSPFFTGTRTSQRGRNSGSCRENTFQYSYITVGTKRTSIAGAFNHTFSEAAELYSFFTYSDSDVQRTDDGLSNSRGSSFLLAPPGAYSGLGGAIELGAFAAAAGLTPPTAADITNSPLALANGGPNVATFAGTVIGYPRHENERNNTWTQTTGVQAGVRGELYLDERRMNYDVSLSWSASALEQTYRTPIRDRSELAANGLGGPNCVPNGITDFDFETQGGPAWSLLGPTVTQKYFPGFVLHTRETMSLALTSNNQGQGDCQFYNPLLTQLVEGTNVPNSPELQDWLIFEGLRADKRNKLAVFDAVVSGELFEMRGGTAQFAVGGQYRRRDASSKAPAINDPGLARVISGYDVDRNPEYHYISNNFECAFCIFNYEIDRSVSAAFLELSIPFWENVESQIALRYEDYGGNIGSEVTPKIALSWRPVDSLLLRGSFSQSFRAPNLIVVEEGLEAGSVTFKDPIRNQAVRAGLVPPINANAEYNSSYTVSAPSPEVGNEYADTFSAGFLWTPVDALDGLSVGADFWRFEVSDRVLPQPGISGIEHEIAAFTAAAQDESNYVLNQTLRADADTPEVPCSPSGLAATFGIDSDERLECVVNPDAYRVEGVVRTQNSTTASMTTIQLATINAGTIEADGVDLRMGYNWESDWGRFRASLDFTHVRQYKFVDVPGLEEGLSELGVFDAAGTTGGNNLVRSMPDNKGNITLSWMRDSHGVTLINRHIGSYRDLSYQGTFDNGNDLVRSLVRTEIDSYNTWDIQYRYTHVWANDNFGTTTFTAGVLDMFNEELPYREYGGLNYDTAVFDGRGRRFYLRALMQL